MTPKPPKCKVCRKPIIGARSSLATSCSVECAIILAKKESAAWDRKQQAAQRKAIREERKARREAKERLKTRAEWLKEAQAAFNAWVRLRDEGKPCISCGTYDAVQWHAGHYRTVKAAPQHRFNPLQVHRQCSQCNAHDSGNVLAYRKGLIARIGLEAVEAIENDNRLVRYTIEDAKRIKAEYTAKARELKNSRNT